MILGNFIVLICGCGIRFMQDIILLLNFDYLQGMLQMQTSCDSINSSDFIFALIYKKQAARDWVWFYWRNNILLRPLEH